MAKYTVTGVSLRIRDKDNVRIALDPGTIVNDSDLWPAAFKDACEHGWLVAVEQPDAPEGTDDNPLQTAFHNLAPNGEGYLDEDDSDETPVPEIVTKTHEDNLDADALDALDADSLLVMVGERVEEGREAVQSALQYLDDPKASAIEFLLASYSERDEFVAACVEQADEQAKVDEVVAEVEEADEALPPMPENRLGKTADED
jgi:hypothetical protein